VSERLPGLTLREAARILAAAVRDKSYREAPLGQDVSRFLRYMRSSYGASLRTLDDYERYLARLAAEHAHLGIRDFEGGQGAELVVDFVDRTWGTAAPGTRRKVLAILSSFFKWGVEVNRLESNPALAFAGRERGGVERHAHDPDRVRAIIAAQPDLRDQVAIALMARLGLRKNELRLLRWKDVDLLAGELRVHAKGGKRPTIPIVYEDLLADLAALSVGTGSDEYVLFPVRVGNLPGQTNVIEHRARPMQPSTMHRWWKRCLRQAGAADFPMHELRHTAGTEFMRATGNLELTRMFMRHDSISTTSEAYLHLDRDDLIEAMQLAGARWAAKE
jgi:integrase